MRHLSIIAAAALAACASGEQGNQSAVDQSNVVEPAARADANHAVSQPVVGDPPQWFSRNDAGQRWAGYGPPFSEAEFSAYCEGGRLVFNTTAVPRTGAGRTTMRVSAAGVDETLPAETNEDGLPNTSATVEPGADWLGRLAGASGELTIQVGDTEPLVVPIGDPLTSLIRDCRSAG